MREVSAGLEQLAERVANILGGANTHEGLPDACLEMGFQAGAEGSKRERLRAGLTGKSPREVAAIAERVGERYASLDLAEAALALSEEGEPAITEITRRDIAQCFDHVSLSGDVDLIRFVKRLWPIESMTVGDDFFGPSLAKKIERQMVHNDDWTISDLFEEIGAWTCSRKRFANLIEAALHPLAGADRNRSNWRSVLTPC
jgi:hypothetical protein